MMNQYGDPDAPTVLIQMVDDHDPEGMEREVREIERMADAGFSLLAIGVMNWNNDLSPWKAAAVFGKESFGSGAEKTLKEVLEVCSDPAKTYIIGDIHWRAFLLCGPLTRQMYSAVWRQPLHLYGFPDLWII